MASRLFTSTAMRAFARPSSTIAQQAARGFRSSAARMNDAAASASGATMAAPAVRRPVGGFRGGLFGFLLGSSAAAYGTYYYVLEEYRVANEMLTEDIYALQAAVQRIHDYVSSLEAKVDGMQKKR